MNGGEGLAVCGRQRQSSVSVTSRGVRGGQSLSGTHSRRTTCHRRRRVRRAPNERLNRLARRRAVEERRRCPHAKPGGRERAGPGRARLRPRRLPVLIRRPTRSFARHSRRTAGGPTPRERNRSAAEARVCRPAARPRSQKIGRRRRSPPTGASRPLTNGRVGTARLLAVTQPPPSQCRRRRQPDKKTEV